jgi:hypothetical protein
VPPRAHRDARRPHRVAAVVGDGEGGRARAGGQGGEDDEVAARDAIVVI